MWCTLLWIIEETGSYESLGVEGFMIKGLGFFYIYISVWWSSWSTLHVFVLDKMSFVFLCICCLITIHLTWFQCHPIRDRQPPGSRQYFAILRPFCFLRIAYICCRRRGINLFCDKILSNFLFGSLLAAAKLRKYLTFSLTVKFFLTNIYFFCGRALYFFSSF